MNEQQKWALRAAGAARAGLSIDSVDLVVLPAYSGRTAPLRADRKDRLRAYLREQLAAIAEPPPAAEATPAEPENDAPLPPLRLETLCATCRGHCCAKGGEHAYLSPRTLRRVLADRLAATGEAVIDAYLGYVPARNYAGSCIYHTTAGCALPRALRSETCTRFLCTGIKTLSDGVARNPKRTVIGVFQLGGWFPWLKMRVMMVRNGKMRALRPERWSGRKNNRSLSPEGFS